MLGAGPAGLAVAGCLVTRGVPTSVLDAGAAVGDSWRQRYDRLHLHTPRIQSGLPGLRPPRSGGRWLAKDDYAAYLAGYARRHGLEPELGVVAERVDRTGDGYTVSTDAGPRRAATVVVATGYQRVPVAARLAGHRGLPRRAAALLGLPVAGALPGQAGAGRRHRATPAPRSLPTWPSRTQMRSGCPAGPRRT